MNRNFPYSNVDVKDLFYTITRARFDSQDYLLLVWRNMGYAWRYYDNSGNRFCTAEDLCTAANRLTPPGRYNGNNIYNLVPFTQ